MKLHPGQRANRAGAVLLTALWVTLALTATPASAQYTFSGGDERVAPSTIGVQAETLYTISGQVRTAGGAAIADVTVTAVDYFTQEQTGQATTDGAGFYAIATIPQGWMGTVTPEKSGYSFIPVDREYGVIFSDQLEQDFEAFGPTPLPTGDPTPTPTPTPDPTPTPSPTPTPTVDPTPTPTYTPTPDPTPNPTPIATVSPTPFPTYTPTPDPTPTPTPIATVSPTPFPTPTPTVDPTPPTPTPVPTVTPAPYPTPDLHYDIIFRRDGRRADELLEITGQGIFIPVGGMGRDTLLIRKKSRNQQDTPPIGQIVAHRGLVRLQTEAPVVVLESQSAVENIVAQQASIDHIQVGQVGQIRIVSNAMEPSLVNVKITDGSLLRNGRAIPSSIQLVGAMLVSLDAPDTIFSAIRSATRVFAIPRTTTRYIALGGIGTPETDIIANQCRLLQVNGGNIDVRHLRCEAPVIRVRALGMNALLAPGIRFPLAASVDAQTMGLFGDRVWVQAVGGDIISGQYLVQGSVVDFSARAQRLAGHPMGGYINNPNGPAEDLRVASGLALFAPQRDIVNVFATHAVNGVFYAGASWDGETLPVDPDYQATLRQMRVGLNGALRGEIHMSETLAARFPRFPNPNRVAVNTVEVIYGP